MSTATAAITSVSVVIPTYDRAALLPRVVAAWAALAPGGEFDYPRAVEGGLESAGASRYAYAVYHVRTELASGTAADPALSLPPLPDAARASSDPDDHVLRVEIRTLRDEQRPSPRTDVYLHLPPGGEPRVVGIDRK